jgi:hypothetical protein
MAEAAVGGHMNDTGHLERVSDNACGTKCALPGSCTNIFEKLAFGGPSNPGRLFIIWPMIHSVSGH